MQVEGSWLSRLIGYVANVNAPDEGHIDPIRLPNGQEVLISRGSIPPHVDHDFADRPWSYILVLRSAGAVLRSHGHADLPLNPGMMVELNVMRRHSLRQPKGATFVWLPLDWHERLSLLVAAERHETMADSREMLRDGSCYRQAAEVSWDGMTVWVNGSDGCCIGRFGRKGVDIHHDATDQMALGRQCLACSHDHPGTPDWDRFVDHMAARGAEVPTAARPRWLA